MDWVLETAPGEPLRLGVTDDWLAQLLKEMPDEPAANRIDPYADGRLTPRESAKRLPGRSHRRGRAAGP